VRFDYQMETIRTPSLALDYFLVPWDTEIVGAPVANIECLEVRDAAKASNDYLSFIKWIEDQEVFLCNCRLSQNQMNEIMFLQERNFRFIELNYYPRLDGLEALDLPEDNLVVEVASEEDCVILAEMAGSVFRHGRFHQDPRIVPALGNHRYRVWMENSFGHPQQITIKCLENGKIVGFFVVEYPETGRCFWSLVGLAPGLGGVGLGKRVWKALLKWHQAEGISTVTTSISSHNIEAFNLYVSLGFRFPQPLVTLHWCPLKARGLS
jgi:ribosomal protein S18 acetylase RimI-like enzyme